MYTITNINNLPIIEIENFLTTKEVHEILYPRMENFAKAISHYPSYYRNNDRLVEDNQELSKILFEKLKAHNILDEETKTKSICINEKLRFCKYQKDQSFSKHQDGIYYPDPFSESKFTFLLYLNGIEYFEGGNTEFYNSKTDEDSVKTIIPKKGKLVIFDHQLWHKGAIVTKGDKYILRSDIIIERITKNTHHDGYIWSLLKLNDNKFLSCGRDTTIKLWDANLKLLNTRTIHTKSILKIVALDESEFISCSRDFTIRRWNLSGEELASITLDEMTLTIEINADKNIIAVGTSGKVYVLNAELSILKTIKVHDGWVWGLAIKSKDVVVTCGEDGKVCLTNTKLGETKCVYNYNQSLFCLSIVKNNIIFAGSQNGTIIQLSLNTKKAYKIKAHNDIIRSIIHHKNNILTCGEDNTVLSIDPQSHKAHKVLESDNFIQDLIVLKNTIYAAGYNGIISKQKSNRFKNQFK